MSTGLDAKSVKVTMIAAALPPQLDGIGDYSARIAMELAKEARVTVLTGDDTEHTPIAGCEVAPVFTPQNPATVKNLIRPIVSDKPDWVLLQYNPFSFGPRGWNPYLPGVMREIKKQSPKTRIAVMAHETFVPYKTLVWMVMGTYQRWQFYQLGQAADLLFLSIEPWARHFASWFPKIPVRHLPVGSNMPHVAITKEEARKRLDIGPETFVIGLFGQAHISRLLDWVGIAAQAVQKEHKDTLLLYIGPHKDNVKAVAGDIPVRAEGPLSSDEVSRRFSAMDVYLTPFTDGVSTRRTSFMTGLLHSIPTVGTKGEHTDPMLLPEAGQAYVLTPAEQMEPFRDGVLSLYRDAALREMMGKKGHEFYHAHFDWPMLIQTMRRAFDEVR